MWQYGRNGIIVDCFLKWLEGIELDGNDAEECNLLLIYGGYNKPSWTLVTCDGLQPGFSQPGGRSSG